MPNDIKLSELVEQIQETIQDRFEGDEYWISAQIMNVKKYASTRRCYLTFEEKENGNKTAEVKAVFWANSYQQIENFEKHTKQEFKNGLEIICLVKVRFHTIYGLNLDVIQIDFAHTIGTLELERQKTLERLLRENPQTILLENGVYKTYNNRLPVPPVIKRIALITAPNSDGQQDFIKETTNNKHGFTFFIREFLTTIQGENAHLLILEQLKKIEKEKVQFDVVAIVRGGGSLSDFNCFDDYELAKCIANFPVPVFTGIGHDRNTSISDLMAREQKTPTKVAALFVDHSFDFENRLIDLKSNFFNTIEILLRNAKEQLVQAKRIVKLAGPEATLNRGFAMIMSQDKIITDPKKISIDSSLQIVLKGEVIHSTVTKKTHRGN